MVAVGCAQLSRTNNVPVSINADALNRLNSPTLH
jgi:hypothetical protein